MTLRRWWPPLVWLAAILTATSLPSSYIRIHGFPGADKIVHFSMYGILGFLIARAMHVPPRTTRLRVVLAAWLLVCAIGGLDEWHQTYIQGRSTELADWLADSSGGLIASLIWAATAARSRTSRSTT